jgi:Asp-tRNA(Asn)/Glu-tRNA(Gln) amidotransferase A subunit family amidase
MSQKEEPPKEMPITEAVIAEAEKITGLTFTESERKMMVKRLNERLDSYEKLRAVKLDNGVPPALRFDPLLLGTTPAKASRRPWRRFKMSKITRFRVPLNPEELALYPVTYLSRLIRSKKVSSVELMKMYLGRLKRYGSILNCVITLTEGLAMAQAKQADEEIASGHYRGPLHGIPWGAKDLLAARGVRTTWGAEPYKDQVFDTNATVVERLEEAGAVLVAKLSLGALAMGDWWFDGQTKNPWKIEEGSSGSSAGSAAAVAGGLVGFALGTETHGSIISPCTRCGVTGLRPTFGRVSRYGAMALSWSMDKIGPIGRSVEDCALVFNAIYGPDGKDATVVDLPFDWNPNVKVTDLRVGYLKSAFEAERENKPYDDQTLAVMRSLGFNLIPIELPDYPISSISFILQAEAAAAFDELTRSNRDDLLARQEEGSWPNSFRAARLIPAVEYIQANRVRTLVMQAMAELMDKIDVYLAPTRGQGPNLLLTNLTGHPAVVVPNGFSAEGRPCSSITFIGQLYDEANVLAVAKAYQDSTDFHLRHPTMVYESKQ